MKRLIRMLPLVFGAVLGGFFGAWLFALSGLGGAATRDWLLAHPEILPKLAESYQRHEAGRRLAGIADEVTRPFPGAVLGNPNGTITLVEFTDYGCTYCRQSVADVNALLAAHPEARVVMREWPIFQGSDVAAKMALAAAQQGKYAAFHEAMFAHAPPTPAAIDAAARSAGLDMAAAQEFAASPAAALELAKNMELARKLGFEGTPSWVVGGTVFSGAVGPERLREALRAASEAS
jgi:protein-disulfide isomerase